ncbi:MAG: bacteriohemerythrin [Myxococcales bacterium]|nr:bacteriohemerythrin [Myxococcales bacterium]
MALFEWSGDYETGVREIDDQHRALVRLINQLDEARSSGSSECSAAEVFDRLSDYVRYHFTAEERALLERGLPEDALRAHQAQHDQFVHRVQRLGSLQRTRTFVASEELMGFLVSWLTDHILRRDRRDLAVLEVAAEHGRGADDGSSEAALRGALAEAIGRFQHLADGIPLLLWSCDEHGRRTWFNRTAVEFVGRERELDEQAWRDAIHPDDRTRAEGELDATLASPELIRREFRLRERGGGYRHLLETLLPRYENHTRFVGLLGCAVDITQQRLGLEVLRDARSLLEGAVAARTAELENANAALKEDRARQAGLLAALSQARAQVVEAHGHAALRTLAAGLAHEMNTPLAVALANVSHLQETLPALVATPATGGTAEELAAELPELIVDTRRALSKIAVIVRALSSYVSESAQDERCELDALASSTADLLKSQLPPDVHLVLDLNAAAEVKIKPQAMLTALLELLINGGRAAAPAGQVTIRTWTGDGVVHLAVSDTGEGIADEHLPHVFEPFFTTREVGRGMGLGLTVARSSIDQAGGSILVESTQGLGSTFTITLPRAE